MAKPVATIMIGLPGLGKSRFVGSEDIDQNRTFIYSTDAYIERYASSVGATYDEVFCDVIAEATEYMDQKLGEAILYHMDIIWDQTNLTKKKRQRVIEKLKHHGYIINGVAILPPKWNDMVGVADWVKRLESREGKTIGADVLQKMIDQFEIPTTLEGFDHIVFYDMYGDWIGIESGSVN